MPLSARLPAESCPRRRAGVACDERTTAAVGNSCSARRMRAVAGSDFIESGAIYVSNVLQSWLSRGGSLWLVPAIS